MPVLGELHLEGVGPLVAHTPIGDGQSAGAGVLFAGATAALRELAELTGMPVFCTMPGKSAFDETHPLSLGAGSGSTTWQAHTWCVR